MRMQREGVSRRATSVVVGARAGRGVAILCAPLRAHHSFATYYLEADTIEIEGDVVEFQYKNPHAWLYVVGQENVRQAERPTPPNGPAAPSSSATASPRRRCALGDSVRIWAAPNRDPNDNRVRLKRIERRSDGFQWGQNRRDSR